MPEGEVSVVVPAEEQQLGATSPQLVDPPVYPLSETHRPVMPLDGVDRVRRPSDEETQGQAVRWLAILVVVRWGEEHLERSPVLTGVPV